MARSLPTWWLKWRRRWEWLSNLDSAISWGQRVWAVRRTIWSVIKWLGWAVTLGLAFLQQWWQAITVGLILLVFLAGEVYLRTRLDPPRSGVKFPKGEVKQGPPPARKDSSIAKAAEPNSGTELETENLFLAPDDADLEMSMVIEQFKPHQGKAMLAEVQVEIRNRTAKKKRVMRMKWEIDGPEDGRPRYYETDVRQALENLKRNHTLLENIVIEPHDTATGWVHVSLPHQISGGVGGYTLHIEDELGTEYVLRRERRGGAETVGAVDTPERLFEIILPAELKPGKIYNHETRWFEDVWISKVSPGKRNLVFKLEVSGYEFMTAIEFQNVYQQYKPSGYFSNPLDVDWTNRQAILAFVVVSGDGDYTDFTLRIRDVGADKWFAMPDSGHWVCLSDGTVSAVDDG